MLFEIAFRILWNLIRADTVANWDASVIMDVNDFERKFNGTPTDVHCTESSTVSICLVV